MAHAAIPALSCAELPAPDAEMLTLQPLPRFALTLMMLFHAASAEMKDASVLMRAHKRPFFVC